MITANDSLKIMVKIQLKEHVIFCRINMINMTEIICDSNLRYLCLGFSKLFKIMKTIEYLIRQGLLQRVK